MNDIIAQARLDKARMDAYGKASGILIILGLPILMSAVMGVLGLKTAEFGSGVLGAVGGSVGFMTVIFNMYPFMITEQFGDVRLDGMIPISRRRQVLGRYLQISVNIVAYLVGLLLVPVILRLTGTPVDMPILATSGVCILLVLILTGIVTPFLYRFSSMSVMRGLGFSVAGLAVIGLLASRAPWDWTAIFLHIVDFLSASTVRTTALGICLAIGTVALSIAFSIHTYQKKDL
ncbi:ABC transporter [Bombiscardovia apis]|uniref:ABC transporter n=1 Tax=Bombiscardovia apis TaxID=2932182 RepID=A0ABM8BDE2_9BIFI|nr:ABC-2 transporter permease [Bombiscardovia apis]BDR54745.1 ABC transporter [Bombiscardovia apis]